MNAIPGAGPHTRLDTAQAHHGEADIYLAATKKWGEKGTVKQQILFFISLHDHL